MEVFRNVWLSLELGGERGSISLHHFDTATTPRLLYSAWLGQRFDHAEKLISALDTALKSTGIHLNAISQLITSSGPGSFTGMRIAYSALKAIAMSQKIPLATVNGSEARCLSWRAGTTPSTSFGPTWVLSYYSQNRAVVARFSGEAGLFEETIVDLDQIAAPLEPTNILLDEKIRPEQLPNLPLPHISLFPLRAEHMVETFARATSASVITELSELILASPNYYGDFRAHS